MANMLVLLSHQLTGDQIQSIYNDLMLDDIIYLPEELKNLWSNIDPNIVSISELLIPFKNWIDITATQGDYIVIQGDMGATYNMINYAFDKKLIPCYTTTKRVTIDEQGINGTVNLTKQFKHVRFRVYEK